MFDWLDHRTGFRDLRHHLFDEPLPPGTGWAFTLGSLLLFGLTLQVLTGTLLALFYAPTPDHAWDSVRYITNDVRGGFLLRGLHHWGASLVVVTAVLHLARVVLFGSYKAPREMNWVVGLVLLHVILAFGLTGYLLPWDQRAYWATVVTINISKLTPLAGEFVADLLRGGSDIGALTLTRWYAVHVLVLPPTLFGLTALHLYLMRRHGISGPITPRSGLSETFFPYQAARDLTVAIVVGAALAILAWQGAPALEPPADPSASGYIPRPEWYFLGLFQLLKYFPGRLEVVGAIVIPGAVMTVLCLLPWIDRARSRGLQERRWLLTGLAAGIAALCTLTVMGAMDTPAQADGEWNVREQAGLALMSDTTCTSCHRATAMSAPIDPLRVSQPRDWLVGHLQDPQMIAPGLRVAPPSNQYDHEAILAALARGRSGSIPELGLDDGAVAVLFNRNCLRCHVMGPVGGAEGPALTTIGATLTEASLVRQITTPLGVKPDGAMPAFAGKLTADEIARLASWLATRR
ncbi:MAG: cytochrome b N-terminal domain-containing protein [Acidobacteria bacterium]|nr:cytochrome b N-terminal domain-containing protein [Acidobacteriota bacterium]